MADSDALILVDEADRRLQRDELQARAGYEVGRLEARGRDAGGPHARTKARREGAGRVPAGDR